MPVHLLQATWPSKQNNFCIFKLVPSRRSIRSCRTWWERGYQATSHPIDYHWPTHRRFDTSFETKENQHWDFLLRGNAYSMSRIYENSWNKFGGKIPTRLQHQNPSPYLPYPQTLMVRRLELKAILVKVHSSSPVIASVHRSELLMKDPEIDIFAWDMGRRRNDKNARNLGTFADQRADMMCKVTTPSTNLSVSAFLGLSADTPRATSRAHHCELYHHLRNATLPQPPRVCFQSAHWIW